MTRKVDSFLTDHLKMWKESGVEAPLNELQSLHAWMMCLQTNGKEKTMEIMRTRMLLLMRAANDLNEAGPEAEDAAGIYDNRPDLKP